MNEVVSARPKSLVYLGGFLLGASVVLAFSAFLLSVGGSILPGALIAGHTMGYWGIVSWLIATLCGVFTYGIARSLNL